MGDPAVWSEFGLPGLVILALFVAGTIVFRKSIDMFRHTQVEHREERKEWREDAARREERGNLAIEKLATAVDNLKK